MDSRSNDLIIRRKAIAVVALLAVAIGAGSASANHEPGHADAAAGAAAGAATAQEHDHSQHGAAATEKSVQLSAASKAFEDAMQKMHKNMAVPYTNDVDVDFVRGMIPHHQGAIDQAETLLKYSKNPRLRLLAGGIIAAQKREIKFMQYWLDQHEKGVESNDMPVWLKSNPANLDEAASPPRSNDKD